MIPKLIIEHVVDVFLVVLFIFRFTVHVAVKVILHLEIIIFFRIVVALVVFIIFVVIFLFLILALVIFETFKLFFMFDLIGDIVLSTFSIAHTHAILLAVLFEVARALLILVILVFLTAEALVDEMNEDALSEVAELDHASQEGIDSRLRLLQADGQLTEDLPRASNLLESLAVD